MLSEDQRLALLKSALKSSRAIARFESLIFIDPDVSDCHWWMGAISSRGHGRFWVCEGYAIVAQRFAYARVHGADALFLAEMITHKCDNPLCQNPAHLTAASAAQNSEDWSWRRGSTASPLSDPHGARARAMYFRNGLKKGVPLRQLIEQRDSPAPTLF